MESVHLQLSEELLARIDAERGMVARNRWIRWAVEQALSEAKEPSGIEQADPGSAPSSEGVRSAAPAEQPEPRSFNGEDVRLSTGGSGFDSPSRRSVPARSSVQAKRDVRPVPKAKP